MTNLRLNKETTVEHLALIPFIIIALITSIPICRIRGTVGNWGGNRRIGKHRLIQDCDQ